MVMDWTFKIPALLLELRRVKSEKKMTAPKESIDASKNMRTYGNHRIVLWNGRMHIHCQNINTGTRTCICISIYAHIHTYRIFVRVCTFGCMRRCIMYGNVFLLCLTQFSHHITLLHRCLLVSDVFEHAAIIDFRCCYKIAGATVCCKMHAYMHA